MRTAVPMAQARTVAGPTRSIANIATDTGSGAPVGGGVARRSRRIPTEAAPRRRPVSPINRPTTAATTFHRVGARVGNLAAIGCAPFSFMVIDSSVR
jgi:hypothetical protein